MNRQFRKNIKEEIGKKKEKEKMKHLQEQMHQQDIEYIQAQQNQKAQQEMGNQFQANEQQQIQQIVPIKILQKLYPQRQYEGNIQQALNYHSIKMMFSYLNGFELVQAKRACQYFNLLIRFSSYKEEKKIEEKVEDNGIRKYLEVDFDKIKGQNLIALKINVNSKDEAWASAKYSSSWVTLKLIKHENDNSDHCTDSENFDEILIVENYQFRQFKIYNKILSSFSNKNPKLTQLYNHIKEGAYDKLAIVMKCQYPGWECSILYASFEFIILEKD